MKPVSRSDRCDARAQRLVRIKFMGIAQDPAPPAGIARSRLMQRLARLRDRFIRAIGCLEAARP